MANEYALGLADIKLKILTINGIAYTGSAFSATGGVTIGEVMEGSTQINDDAPTETKFKGDYTDATLLSLFQRGDFSMETDIVSVDGSKFAILTGGTYVSTPAKKVTVPSTAPNILGEVYITFDQGVNELKFPNAQIVANYAGANLKTELFKLHLKVIGLADTNGNVAEITLPA
jgi:hypothetical protein